MLKNTKTLILSLFVLSGCEQPIHIPEQETLNFVVSQSSFKFMDKPHPKGSIFNVEALEDGRSVAWAYEETGASYAPVVMVVNSSIKMGIVLDENLCSTGEYIQDPSLGPTVISRNIPAKNRLSNNVCFTRQ